jgi:outer membrane protein assembly factor BamB
MKTSTFWRAALCAAVLLGLVSARAASDWPAWRGPLGTGLSDAKNLPVKWDRTNAVKWRIPLPDRGNSTPIVFGNKVFLTQAVKQDRLLLCLDKKSGRGLWRASVQSQIEDTTHEVNPQASASPVTDGERVIAAYGSDGLFCYDMDGKELWRRTDLGRQIHIWGNGASPAIYGELCYLNFGPGETTYLAAFDKQTGKTVWKNIEDTGYKSEDPAIQQKGNTYIGSWTTPVIMPVGGKPELLVSWPGRLAAYGLRDGKELWFARGLNPLVYTSPIYQGNIVVTSGGYNGATLALRAGGEGDVTEKIILWKHPKTKQRIGSGVIHEGYYYIHNDPGIAECFELSTGKLVWEERLKGPGPSGVNWSSLMLANGNCYSINQGGDCFVFKASPKFELVSVNPLGETSNSSIVPASDRSILIRTHKALWLIENTQ